MVTKDAFSINKYRHKYIHFNHCQNLFRLFMYMHINLFYLVFILTNYCIIYSFIFVFLRPFTGIIRWTVQDGFVRCDLVLIITACQCRSSRWYLHFYLGFWLYFLRAFAHHYQMDLRTKYQKNIFSFDWKECGMFYLTTGLKSR